RTIGSYSPSAECRYAASQEESDGNAGNRQTVATDAHTWDTNRRAGCVNPVASALRSSRTRTTSPTTTVAGGSRPSSATRSASVARVATTVRCVGSVPLAITAAGVSGSAPCSSSRAVISGNADSPISTTSVGTRARSEEHTSELQSLAYLVCRLLLEKKKIRKPVGSRQRRYAAQKPQELERAAND